MDKYDIHLKFLIEVFPDVEENTCKEIFTKKAKRDVRKALFYLVQPKINVDDLIEKFKNSKNKEEQLYLLQQILNWYCPNKAYSKIVKQLEKGIPFTIDTATLPKLKNFRRAPRIERLKQLLDVVASSELEIIESLLILLLPFGRELEPLWSRIDAYANYPDFELAKAAMNLLSKIPSGIQKSIITFANHCTNPKMRFHTLYSMQNEKNLPSKVLLNIFSPIIAEYQRLVSNQGAMNDLWQEFRLIQQILKNNGVVLSIPNIRLGRF
ncbi:MAG: hypothetical protein MK207_03400 [Saprospiraceae bacterium]|nr:hypothetical protein [Saprospiraceae bacterium]